MPEREIVIPPELLKEKSVRLLITQWRNLHLRHRECRKRVAWTHRHASKIEKKRRREKWEITARILEIERQLIVWAAKATHDPEIYSAKKGKSKDPTPKRKAADRTKLSRLTRLRHDYDRNRSVAHNTTGKDKRQKRADLRTARKAIVAEIRGIVRAWMSAIYLGVYPDGKPPRALPLHPAELVPRKLKAAQRKIREEVAA